MSYLLLALGGIAGALCRYYGVRAIQTRTTIAFPLGTYAINLSGSFMLGLLAALLTRSPAWPVEELGLLLGVGFCGAYTTFSSFAFETIQLWRQARHRRALLNLMSQPLLGAFAAWIGLLLGG